MAYAEDRSKWYEGQGLWSHVPEAQWRDWTWQLKNRITSVEQIERHLTLTPEEKAGLDKSAASVKELVGVINV